MAMTTKEGVLYAQAVLLQQETRISTAVVNLNNQKNGFLDNHKGAERLAVLQSTQQLLKNALSGIGNLASPSSKQENRSDKEQPTSPKQ